MTETEPGQAASQTWTVHTDVFDGPLDLLLYLVKRDGVDLRSVPVAEIATSYLAYLDRMRELNLSVASDYLVMAATLTWLKSRELLPRPPTPIDEDEEDPKEALARRLEAYERVKEGAENLDALVWVDRDVFKREPEPLTDETRPWIPGTDAFGLLEAYHQVLVRASTPPPSFTILRSGLSIVSTCRVILGHLNGSGNQADLGDLLRLFDSRAERVVAFIGTLEMARQQWVRLEQRRHLAPVVVTALINPNADLSAITGSVEDG